jgi:hypothetical protein
MALTELDEDALRIFTFEPIASFEGCREKPAFLGHGALLCDQEVAFVSIEKENSPYGQKDEEDVECEQPERDAGGMAELQGESSV